MKQGQDGQEETFDQIAAITPAIIKQIRNGSCQHRWEASKINLQGADIFWDGRTINIRRSGAKWYEFILFFFMLLLFLPVLAGAIVAIIATLHIAIFKNTAIGYLLAIFFLIAVVPGVFVFVWIQSLMFTFKVQLNPKLCRYRLRNGLLWLSIIIRTDKYNILVYPTYSRGAWGYGACLSFSLGRLPIRLPVIPKSIFGTKHDALQEAKELVTWLNTITLLDNASLKWWGDYNKIIAGRDYIR